MAMDRPLHLFLCILGPPIEEASSGIKNPVRRDDFLKEIRCQFGLQKTQVNNFFVVFFHISAG